MGGRVRGGGPVAHVALLRAVNVAGRALPMSALAAMFTAAGAEAVATYIQSGNVVFVAAPAAARRIAAAVERAIVSRIGFAAPIVLRTAAELAAVVGADPFPAAPRDRVYVGFLADRPGPERIAALDPARSPPDAFAVIGREIYLHLASGAGQSELTVAYLDRVLATTTTVRNWRTTVALADRAAAATGAR